MPSKLAPGIRERRPGYFEIRVYGGLDPLTGKPRQVSAVVRGTVKDANAKRSKLLLEIAQNGPSAPERHTVSQLFDAVLTHLVAMGREETTIHGYRSIARRAAGVFGRIQLAKLKAGHLDAYYARLIAEGAKPATVRRHHAFIRRSLAQACKWDWVESNVADRASPPSEPHRPMGLQTADAVVALIAAAEQSREPELGIAFRLLAALGGRRGEVCGLRWSDFDLDGGVCVIRRAVKQLPGRVVVGDAKNHQQRTLLLDPSTGEQLRRHYEAMTARAAAAGVWLVADAYVLSDEVDGGEPWRPNRLTQALGRLRARTGYTGRLHDLRHWHASQLLGAGEPPVVVAARLGHRDPSTTHRWYSHAMPRADARAAAFIGEVLGPSGASGAEEAPPAPTTN